MKTLITVLALLTLASTVAEAQPRRPEQQAAEQGWRDYQEGRQPPAHYVEGGFSCSTSYTYWSTYSRKITGRFDKFMGR